MRRQRTASAPLMPWAPSPSRSTALRGASPRSRGNRASRLASFRQFRYLISTQTKSENSEVGLRPRVQSMLLRPDKTSRRRRSEIFDYSKKYECGPAAAQGELHVSPSPDEVCWRQVRWLALLVIRAPSANGTGNQIYASANSKRRPMCSHRDSIQSMRLDIEAYCRSRMPTRVLISRRSSATRLTFSSGLRSKTSPMLSGCPSRPNSS